MNNDKAHVTMEPMTRKMIIPKETEFIGIVGDNEGERVDIDIPRWYDGIDLGTKRLYIVVSNDGGQSDMIIPDVTKDEETLHLTWVVLGRHVAMEGTVYAHIRATDENGFVWQSLDGEYVVQVTQTGPESMPEPQITAVEQKLQEMDTAKQDAISAAAQALAAATETAPPIVPTADGSVIAISDSADRPLRGVKIFGRTTQNGTPTPDAPIPLVTVGADGDVQVCVKAGLPEGGNEHITIITQPRSVTALEETSVVFSVAAKGEKLTYQWEASTNGGVGWVNSSAASATTAALTLTARGYMDGYLYRCLITDANGNTLRTDVATLTIGDTSATENPVTVQTATITTPNGLPGVPVTSGGNYTDANGQQWIADSVVYDADTGVAKYVQRVRVVRLTFTSHGWSQSSVVEGRYLFNGVFKTGARPMCTAFVAVDSGTAAGTVYNNQGKQMCFNTSFATIDEWKAYLDTNEIYLAYAMAEPVETDLSADDLAPLAELRTHYPNTTIYNGDGAHMAVSYVADTKNYIDQKIQSIATAMIANI